MTGVPSPLSLIAAILYLVVAVAAIWAMISSLRSRQVMWHTVAWITIAAIFLSLAMMRVFAAEEMARMLLRGLLQSEGAYDKRRIVQGPLFAVVFITAAAILAGFVYFSANHIRGRRNMAAVVAIGGAGGMVFLLLLRIISLHSVDDLLYGPLKLSWIGDIGMTLAVLGSAIRYATVVSLEPPEKGFTAPRGPR